MSRKAPCKLTSSSPSPMASRQLLLRTQAIVIKLHKATKATPYPTSTIELTDFRTKTSGSLKRKKLRLELRSETIVPFLIAKDHPTVPSEPHERCWVGNAGAERFSGQQYEDALPCAPKRLKPAPGVPLVGAQLKEYLEVTLAHIPSPFPVGTRLWIACAGRIRWPAVAWSSSLCPKKDLGDLVLTYRPSKILVRYYGQHSSSWVPSNACQVPDGNESYLFEEFQAWGKSENKVQLVELALLEVSGADSNPESEKKRMLSLYDRHQTVLAATKRVVDTCYVCREDGGILECVACQRLFHTFCLTVPAVNEEYLPDGRWTCPCCGEEQELGAAARARSFADDSEDAAERMGLTPDWIIEAAAFQVFNLPRPSADHPYVKGLLDPCTNSKIAPNIPAELLYDKKDNGLLLVNSWAGYYVLLNPDYRAQVQWRFVNRAIDEVESGAVPAVILVCRNSTDTGYFQRLRCYPRILLRRTAAHFKDYDNTPIGFGIAIFCLAGMNHRRTLFSKFFDAFELMGEPSIPVDRVLVSSDDYFALLDRLREYSRHFHRDNWVQCSMCSKWRIISSSTLIGDDEVWDCSRLNPPLTSCHTPLTKEERIGGHYAAGWSAERMEEADNAHNNSHSDVPAPHHCPPLLCPMSVDVCEKTLADLICLPPRNTSLTDYLAPAASEAHEYGTEQVLTALELARRARIAANRAYLSKLGLTPGSINGGEIAPLPPDNEAMVKAARELARQAAVEASHRQLEGLRRRKEAAARARASEEALLLKRLAEIRREDTAAKREADQAEKAAAQILNSY